MQIFQLSWECMWCVCMMQPIGSIAQWVILLHYTGELFVGPPTKLQDAVSYSGVCFTLPAWSTGSWAGFSSYRILFQTSSIYGLLLRQKRYRLIWMIPCFPSVLKLWISQIGRQPNFWVVADLMTNTSICVFAGSECK